jgi:hypothetical protein
MKNNFSFNKQHSSFSEDNKREKLAGEKRSKEESNNHSETRYLRRQTCVDVAEHDNDRRPPLRQLGLAVHLHESTPHHDKHPQTNQRSTAG